MLVINLETGEEVEAKRYKDLSEIQKIASFSCWGGSHGDHVDSYIMLINQKKDNGEPMDWCRYMFDSEVAILSEKWTSEG